MHFSICYVSSVNSLSNNQLEVLFDQTTKSNLKNHVSGVLLCNSGNFFQYMEGKETIIKTLYYDKIKKDTRHKNPIVLFEKEIDHLYFEGYESGFSSVLGKEKIAKLSAYIKLLKHLDTKEVEAVTSTITSFLGKSIDK